jgi:hypothetical protein
MSGEATRKRTIVARSYSHPAAYDCGTYLTHRFARLHDVLFTVESDGSPGNWRLILDVDLDLISGKVDLGYTHMITEAARGFITGRGGLPVAVRIPKVKLVEKKDVG